MTPGTDMPTVQKPEQSSRITDAPTSRAAASLAKLKDSLPTSLARECHDAV